MPSSRIIENSATTRRTQIETSSRMFQNQTFDESLDTYMESIQNLTFPNSYQNLVANESVQNLTKISINENLTITKSEKRVSLTEIHKNIVQRIKKASEKLPNNPPTFKNVS